MLDPGLGFAKDAEHNWALLARLDRLHALGRPVLVGASRKWFLGPLLAGGDGVPRPVGGARRRHRPRSSVLAAAAGAWASGCTTSRATRDAVTVVAAARAAAERRVGGAVTPHPETQAVLRANQALYDAFESGDIDLMSALWLDGPEAGSVACIHPGWSLLRGRDVVLRSWAMIMANTSYIQFVLTDVEAPGHRRRRGRHLRREHAHRPAGRPRRVARRGDRRSGRRPCGRDQRLPPDRRRLAALAAPRLAGAHPRPAGGMDG